MATRRIFRSPTSMASPNPFKPSLPIPDIPPAKTTMESLPSLFKSMMAGPMQGYKRLSKISSIEAEMRSSRGFLTYADLKTRRDARRDAVMFGFIYGGIGMSAYFQSPLVLSFALLPVAWAVSNYHPSITPSVVVPEWAQERTRLVSDKGVSSKNAREFLESLSQTAQSILKNETVPEKEKKLAHDWLACLKTIQNAPTSSPKSLPSDLDFIYANVLAQTRFIARYASFSAMSGKSLAFALKVAFPSTQSSLMFNSFTLGGLKRYRNVLLDTMTRVPRVFAMAKIEKAVGQDLSDDRHIWLHAPNRHALSDQDLTEILIEKVGIPKHIALQLTPIESKYIHGRYLEFSQHFGTMTDQYLVIGEGEAIDIAEEKTQQAQQQMSGQSVFDAMWPSYLVARALVNMRLQPQQQH